MITLARGLLNAFVTQEIDDLKSILHPDVDWVVYGPIDMFPFLGAQRGRGAVLSACADLLRCMQVAAATPERHVIAGDTASVLLRCTLRPIRIDNAVNVRIAAFVKLKDGLIGDVRVVVDTFDLVEQSLGREINLPIVA